MNVHDPHSFPDSGEGIENPSGWLLTVTACAVDGQNAVGVFLAGFGGDVEVTHLRGRGRSLRGVVIRQALEQRASIHPKRDHRWQTGQRLIVAHDEEPADATFEIGFGVPCDLIAPVTRDVTRTLNGGGGGVRQQRFRS